MKGEKKIATDYKNLYIYFGRGNGKSTYSTNVIERINEEMYMNDMVRHLEQKGFLVIKEYDGRSGSYIFTITKGGVAYSEDFKYPASGDWRYKDEKQKEFLKNIVENFYIYTTRKEEEKEMNKNWKVTTATKLNNGLSVLLHNDNVENMGVMDIQNCLDTIQNALNKHNTYTNCYKCPKPNFAIKDVIFNPPATIVFWEDGTKTVVKAGEYDLYDPEVGLAMAIAKKALGNQGSYYNTIRKWLDKYQEEAEKAFAKVPKADDISFSISDSISDLVDKLFNDYMKSKPIGTVKSVRETEDGLFAEIEPTKHDSDWVE